MSGNKALLDTNIIILASKNQIDIEQLFLQFDSFHVSIITYMEVYGFPFTNQQELSIIDQLFETLNIIEVDNIIAKKVIEYRKTAKRKIKLPDAIILATANYINADLITDDWDDFENIDNTVKILKTDNYKLLH